jgi:hypothetical protein
MVAYSFAPQFAEAVATGAKRQTVRARRARHARVGEPVQLYAGMRTKFCRKLRDHDPVCTAVLPCAIAIAGGLTPEIIEIIIDGTRMTPAASLQFAIDDGFGGDGDDAHALVRMAAFWALKHGTGRFCGVLIRWEIDPAGCGQAQELAA